MEVNGDIPFAAISVVHIHEFLQLSRGKFDKNMRNLCNSMDMNDIIKKCKYCKSFVNKFLLDLYLLIFSGSISISNKSIWASLRCFHSRKPPIPTGWGHKPGSAIGRWRCLLCVSLRLTVVAWQLLLVSGNHGVWKRYGLSVSVIAVTLCRCWNKKLCCPYVRYHSRIGIYSEFEHFSRDASSFNSGNNAELRIIHLLLLQLLRVVYSKIAPLQPPRDIGL